MKRLGTGIYHTAQGIRATVKARGIQREKRYPAGTSLRTIKDWQERERAHLKDQRPPAARFTLAHDIDRYLDTLGDRRELKKERTRQLTWWRDQFGTLRRSDITATMIRTALVGLRETKAASTCNHYRLALSHLWSTLDGKNASNPLRDVPQFEEPEAEPRAIPDALLDRLFAALPDMGHALKGQRRALVSKTKLRLAVMRETGFSPAEIKRIQPDDLRLDEGAVFVRRRQKGKGVEGVMMPLTEAGVIALRAFAAGDAFGTFVKRPMYSAWTRACQRLLQSEDLTDLERRHLLNSSPYDLRHSFGTRAFRATKSLKATQDLMRHRSSKTTRRYTLAAVPEYLRAAMDLMAGKPAKP